MPQIGKTPAHFQRSCQVNKLFTFGSLTHRLRNADLVFVLFVFLFVQEPSGAAPSTWAWPAGECPNTPHSFYALFKMFSCFLILIIVIFPPCECGEHVPALHRQSGRPELQTGRRGQGPRLHHPHGVSPPPPPTPIPQSSLAHMTTRDCVSFKPLKSKCGKDFHSWILMPNYYQLPDTLDRNIYRVAASMGSFTCVYLKK